MDSKRTDIHSLDLIHGNLAPDSIALSDDPFTRRTIFNGEDGVFEEMVSLPVTDDA